MATARLGRYEVERERLPSACMKCGAPATLYKNKNFAWFPPWTYVLLLAGVLPFVIVQLVLTKRMTVSAPLCEAHKHHWLVRTLIGAAGLVLLLGGFIGFVVLMAAVGDQLDEDAKGALVGAMCSGFGVLLLVWLIVMVVLQNTAIRSTEITDNAITLTGVSPAFVEAVDAEREQWEEEDYRPRRRARRERSDKVFDPEAPRRRPAPPDAYEAEDK